tara:strand:- start:332 stop:643 length:312 start_codon:yes stop_codon:yes gene_type:complete
VSAYSLWRALDPCNGFLKKDYRRLKYKGSLRRYVTIVRGTPSSAKIFKIADCEKRENANLQILKKEKMQKRRFLKEENANLQILCPIEKNPMGHSRWLKSLRI